MIYLQLCQTIKHVLNYCVMESEFVSLLRHNDEYASERKGKGGRQGRY